MDATQFIIKYLRNKISRIYKNVIEAYRNFIIESKPLP